MRQLIIPLGTLLAVISLAACSSDDSSSGEQAPPPASQLKNDTPQQQQPQNQDASKNNPTQQPVQQSPIPQGNAGYFTVNGNGQTYMIPSNTVIPISFRTAIASDPEKNVILPGQGDDGYPEDKLPIITAHVLDVQGRTVFAPGAALIGTLKMSAPKAIFNVTGVKYASTAYSLAASADVTSVKSTTKDPNIGNILIGTAGGAGIALLIDGLTGDRSITWWAPLIGATAGGLAALFFAQSKHEVVGIRANESAVLVPGPR